MQDEYYASLNIVCPVYRTQAFALILRTRSIGKSPPHPDRTLLGK